MDIEFRKHAEEIISYFDESVQECLQNPDYKIEVWQKGLDTAQEWLRLIDAEKVTQNELLSFIRVVHANRYRTSMWFSFAEVAYDWASSKEVSLPPREVFLKSDGLRRESLKEISATSSAEYAQTLHNIFRRYSNEDPNSEVWTDGLKIISEWLRLLKNEKCTESEISTLWKGIDRNFNQYPGTAQWLDTVLAVGYWCKSIGQLDLVPKRFQMLLG